MDNVINLNQTATLSQAVDTSTSPTYRKISHADIQSVIEQNLNARGHKWSKTVTSPRKKSTIQHIQYKLTDMTTTVNGDDCSPMIIVKNSLNRECALSLTGGFFRFVCSNGLVIGDTVFKGRIIHRKGETFEEKIEELDFQIAAFFDNVDNLAAEVEEMVAVQLTEEQMVNITGNLNVPKRVKTEAIERITVSRKRKEDEGNNVWTLLNIVNEAINDKCRTDNAKARHNEKLLDDIYLLAA